MTHRLPLILCNVATRLLPASRRSWADGMIAELLHADDARAALNFASGCLLAALRERARDADTHVMAALWTIAVVTAFYAVVQLVCAVRGVAVLFGAHDGMLAALLRMVSNIRDVLGRQPGTRLLAIVGASHKGYYEAYLNQMHDVRLVDTASILGK